MHYAMHSAMHYAMHYAMRGVRCFLRRHSVSASFSSPGRSPPMITWRGIGLGSESGLGFRSGLRLGVRAKARVGVGGRARACNEFRAWVVVGVGAGLGLGRGFDRRIGTG